LRSLSVELKLLLAFVAIAAVVSLASRRVVGAAYERSVSAVAAASLQADAFEARERSELDKLAAVLDALLAHPELRDAFAARDRDRLLALAAPIFETLRRRDGVSHWYFHAPDPERTVFLRVHRPELFGDRVDRVTLRRAAETRDLGAGKELGKTSFALRAVRPWLHDGVLLGYMELAVEIDGFLAAMKARTGDEYGLVVRKGFLDEREWASALGSRANTWNDRADVVVVDATSFTDGLVDFAGDLDAVPEHGRVLGEIERADRAFVRGVFPLRDASGRRVGALFVLRDFTAHRATKHEQLARVSLALVVFALAGAGAVALGVRLLVFRRLARLRRALERRAAEERLPPARVVELRSEDELGRLEGLFERLADARAPRDGPPGAAAADGGAATQRRG
jgi:hypothetical protein